MFMQPYVSTYDATGHVVVYLMIQKIHKQVSYICLYIKLLNCIHHVFLACIIDCGIAKVQHNRWKIGVILKNFEDNRHRPDNPVFSCQVTLNLSNDIG